jgi:hypothetical protein
MVRNSIYLLFIGIFFFSYCSPRNIKLKLQTRSSCKGYLLGISDSWKGDSMGNQGNRNELYLSIIDHCDFIGFKWNEIEPLFGKANKQGNQIGTYSFTYFSKIDSTFKFPIREFIIINVDSQTNKVIQFRRGYNDSPLPK